jgi:hypothetical protein
MSDFESEYGYWDFARTVRNERRWVFDGKAGNFLSAVRAASKSRTHQLKPGSRPWRAQVGCKFEEDEHGAEWERPLPEARMVPDPKYIKHGGRVNPPGFAYLYLANNAETALAEMRPSVGESVTLAIFELQQDVNLVVCRPGPENALEWLFEEKPSADKLNKYVWNNISEALGRPVNQGDQESAYVPTQILAEVFKAEGFDGLAYRSGLERGTNVVLFDVRVAKQTHHRFVYTLKKVRYVFEAAPNYAIYRQKSDGGQALTEIQTESP